MIFGVYAIRDVKSGFLQPTVELNDQVALRNFAHACMQGESLFFTHAADYSLYKIGTFNSETGILTSLELLQNLGEATFFVEV